MYRTRPSGMPRKQNDLLQNWKKSQDYNGGNTPETLLIRPSSLDPLYSSGDSFLSRQYILSYNTFSRIYSTIVSFWIR